LCVGKKLSAISDQRKIKSEQRRCWQLSEIFAFLYLVIPERGNEQAGQMSLKRLFAGFRKRLVFCLVFRFEAINSQLKKYMAVKPGGAKIPFLPLG